VHQGDAEAQGDLVEVAFVGQRGAAAEHPTSQVIAPHLLVVREAARAEEDRLAGAGATSPWGVSACTPTTRPSSSTMTPVTGSSSATGTGGLAMWDRFIEPPPLLVMRAGLMGSALSLTARARDRGKL
jgi:hypothetical protein